MATVETMSSKKPCNCKKMLLVGNEGCSVVFCPECGVVDVAVGTLTTRFERESVRTHAATLMQAAKALNRTQNAVPTDGNAKRAGAGNVH